MNMQACQILPVSLRLIDLWICVFFAFTNL
jgi:hypothetical protein